MKKLALLLLLSIPQDAPFKKAEDAFAASKSLHARFKITSKRGDENERTDYGELWVRRKTGQWRNYVSNEWNGRPTSFGDVRERQDGTRDADDADTRLKLRLAENHHIRLLKYGWSIHVKGSATDDHAKTITFSDIKAGGIENIDGRPARKIELAVNGVAERPLKQTVWIDKETGIPVRRAFRSLGVDYVETYVDLTLNADIADAVFDFEFGK